MNEGQRQLIASGLSIPDVMQTCNVGKSTVSQWRSGKRVPEPHHRRAIEIAHGIPASTWESSPGEVPSPGETATASTTATAASPAGSDAPSTSADDRIRQLQGLLDAVRRKREDSSLAPAELAKLASTEGGLVERLARLESTRRAEMVLLEARMVREHPSWLRVKSRILGVLKRHPDVAREVLAALTTEAA